MKAGDPSCYRIGWYRVKAQRPNGCFLNWYVWAASCEGAVVMAEMAGYRVRDPFTGWLYPKRAVFWAFGPAPTIARALGPDGKLRTYSLNPSWMEDFLSLPRRLSALAPVQDDRYRRQWSSSSGSSPSIGRAERSQSHDRDPPDHQRPRDGADQAGP